jgi:O-antigen ligase
VAWFAAVAGFTLLYALAGRGTLVGIAAGAAAVGLMFGRASFPTLRYLGLGAAFGLVLFALIFWLLPLAMGLPPGSSADYYGSRLGSVEMRLYLWRIALSYIEQAPWLGIGPMQYAHVPTGDAAHPHNIYLQIGAEWGLPMLVVVVLSGLLALHRLAAAVRRCATVRDRDCGVGLVLACVAIGVDGLFSGNFVMPVSQVWIAFTFGWAAAWWAAQHQDKPEALSEKLAAVSMKRVLALALLASQLWFVWSIWPELRQLDAHIQQVMDRVPTVTMNPRFWSHGWF